MQGTASWIPTHGDGPLPDAHDHQTDVVKWRLPSDIHPKIEAETRVGPASGNQQKIVALVVARPIEVFDGPLTNWTDPESKVGHRYLGQEPKAYAMRITGGLGAEQPD